MIVFTIIKVCRHMLSCRLFSTLTALFKTYILQSSLQNIMHRKTTEDIFFAPKYPIIVAGVEKEKTTDFSPGSKELFLLGKLIENSSSFPTALLPILLLIYLQVHNMWITITQSHSQHHLLLQHHEHLNQVDWLWFLAGWLTCWGLQWLHSLFAPFSQYCYLSHKKGLIRKSGKFLSSLSSWSSLNSISIINVSISLCSTTKSQADTNNFLERLREGGGNLIFYLLYVFLVHQNQKRKAVNVRRIQWGISLQSSASLL